MFYIYIFITLGQQSLAALAWPCFRFQAQG